MTARVLCMVLMALVAIPAAAAEAALGRLFFTPAERNALEEARRRNVRAEVQATEAASKPKPAPVRSITVTGVVRRSDGESTVWVNGKPVDGATEDGLKVRVTAGGQAAVIVHQPEAGRTVRLKVGQQADIVSGRVRDAYEAGAEAARQQADQDGGGNGAVPDGPSSGLTRPQKPRDRNQGEEQEEPSPSEAIPEQ